MWRQNSRYQKDFSEIIQQIHGVISFLYDTQVADELMKNYRDFRFDFSKQTGRLRYVYEGNELLLTLIPNNGYFIPSLFAAERIKTVANSPKYRIIVEGDAAKYAAESKSVFTQHVIGFDPELLPNCEVLVVDKDDKLAAIGKLNVPVHFITKERNGVAVKVKKGNKSYGEN